jgi:hypothetical protein
MTLKNEIRIVGYILLLAIVNCGLLSACNSQKKELQEEVEKLQSKAIEIPYEQMACWACDSIVAISPWNKAKLKLVHYLDSATCTTCYLQKAAINEFICRIEKMSENEFYNVFIITPGSKAKKRLKSDFLDKRTPQTIFVDSANVFIQMNPNIPSESMYHTFLLDEENKVVLVGNPMLNKQIEDMMLPIVEEKLGKKFSTPK